MSSTLMWKPVMPEEGQPLPRKLKFVISRKLWDTDGSCGEGHAVVDESLIPYLEGLRDAGVDGAEELIEIIRKHGVVSLWHEH